MTGCWDETFLQRRAALKLGRNVLIGHVFAKLTRTRQNPVLGLHAQVGAADGAKLETQCADIH